MLIDSSVSAFTVRSVHLILVGEGLFEKFEVGLDFFYQRGWGSIFSHPERRSDLFFMTYWY